MGNSRPHADGTSKRQNQAAEQQHMAVYNVILAVAKQPAKPQRESSRGLNGTSMDLTAGAFKPGYQRPVVKAQQANVVLVAARTPAAQNR